MRRRTLKIASPSRWSHARLLTIQTSSNLTSTLWGCGTESSQQYQLDHTALQSSDLDYEICSLLTYRFRRPRPPRGIPLSRRPWYQHRKRGFTNSRPAEHGGAGRHGRPTITPQLAIWWNVWLAFEEDTAIGAASHLGERFRGVCKMLVMRVTPRQGCRRLWGDAGQYLADFGAGCYKIACGNDSETRSSIRASQLMVV